MPSIGNHSFIVLNGQVQGFGQAVENITRPFVDGLAVRKLGVRSAPFAMQSVTDFASADGADDEFADYQADQGDIVDITDQLGETHSNFIILSVNRSAQREVPLIVGGAGGNSGRVVLTCDWQLQAAGNPNAS